MKHLRVSLRCFRRAKESCGGESLAAYMVTMTIIMVHSSVHSIELFKHSWYSSGKKKKEKWDEMRGRGKERRKHANEMTVRNIRRGISAHIS